jgi:tetratricopeptide (TPR) repeat protein
MSLRTKEWIMSVKMVRSALLTFAFLLFSGVSFAQVGSIAGKVIGEDGQPLQNAQILIERQDVRGNYKVKTKKKGDFFHAGLPIGTYKVSVEVDGKIAESVNGVRVGMGDPTNVDFDLAEIKRRQQAASSGNAAPSQEQLRTMSEAERKAYEEALKKRQQQISKNKELNEAFNAGMMAKEMKEVPAAVEKFKAASAIDAEQHVVWAQLADAQLSLGQTKTGDERNQILAEAVDSYDKAIALQPTNGAYMHNKGLALVRIGKLDEGKAALTKAAELDPVNGGKYYFNLGAIMVNSNNTEGAVEAFKKATEIDPKYAEAYFQLGTALVGKAEMKEDGSIVPVAGTVEAFQKYVELSPNGPNAEAAKSMIASLTGTVSTTFENKPKGKK